MKREIKFRAYVSKDSRYNVKVGMINSESIKEILQDKLTKIPAEWTWSEIGLVMMQFTGLKDKNGKEIYEGDIVKYNKQNLEIRYFDNYGMFGLVGENSYSSKMIDESKPMGSRGSSTNYKPYVLNEYYQKRIEIIGNIHENPELLK